MKPIYTIGYQSATQDALVEQLLSHDIALLADIRALPLSRRAGFSKTSLASAAEQAGIAYRHFKHLGTPREGRDAARRGDYATLERVYSGQLELPEAMAQMAELVALAKQRRTCLLCFCGEAEKCHRSLLIADAFDGFAPVHLHPNLSA